MLWYVLIYKLYESAEVLVEKYFPGGGKHKCVCSLKKMNIVCLDIIMNQFLPTYF